MKKFGMMLAAVAAAFMVSCNQGGGAAKGGDLKDEADTLCYALGMNMGGQIKAYAGQMGIDSTYLEEVVKGFEEGSNLQGDAKKKAYLFGVFLTYQSMEGNGMQPGIREGLQKEIYGEDSTKTINLGMLMDAFRAAALEKSTKFHKDSVQSIMQSVSERLQARKMEKEFGAWKKENEAYNQKLAKNPELKPLGDGVYYKEIKAGNGAKPTATDKVKINYEGKLINDTVFDSSYKRGEAAEMPLQGVVPGFSKALSQMPVGATWEIYIPAEQGYGTQNMGEIKPFSTLIFKVDMLSIVKGEAEQPQAVNLPQAEVVPAQ